MKKKIIIAEKPSVAEEYAKVLGVSGDKKKGYLEGNDWIVTWTIGHLVTMSYPDKYNPAYKDWKAETLPFLPAEFKYEIIEDVKHQFFVIKELYNRSDIEAIYYAGDSGREGLYIQMLVRMMAGHNPLAEEKVVWIDSQTEDEILRGIAEAKSIKDYAALSSAGYMRAKEDYLVGINFSRLLTVYYAAMVNTGSDQKRHVPISIGRVMSCVLGMVVNREREIKVFKPTDFYRIESLIDISGNKLNLEWRLTDKSKMYNSPKIYSEFGFLSKDEAESFIKGLDKITVTNIENVIEKKNAPLLYNLAELQSDCTRLLHISPGETLKIVQSLYEKRLTTYPRTDARVLSTAVSKEINKNLEGLKSSSYSVFIDKITSNNWTIKGKYIDDSKITDHYAIIPTGKMGLDLTDKEKNVYDLIVKRFLAIFYPPAEFEKLKVEADVNNEYFTGNAKCLISRGFYDVLDLPDEEDNNDTARLTSDVIRLLSIGSVYDASYETKKGSTKAPKRYSSGSMILAMENAGKLIEDDELREQISSNGIGTSATRADVIDKLIKFKYIESDKKQILSPTNLGEMIYEVIDYSIPDFLSPEITAKWEKNLSDIASGVISDKAFEADLYGYIRETCDSIKEKYQEGIEEIKRRIRVFATKPIRTEVKEFENWNTKIKCPLCGDELETTAWGFKCKSYKGKDIGCQFMIGDVLGHRLLTNELAELLIKKRTGPYYDFISSKGKPFAAYMVWNDDTKKLSFDFTEMPWEKTEYKCPSCGKTILNQGAYYKCEDYIDKDNGCSFFIGKIAGKSISKTDIEKLCKTGETDLIKGFKSKADKKFDAFLFWDKDKKSISFRFPNENEVKTDLKCPLCGGEILEAPFGFKCKFNTKKDEGCDFFASTIGGHQIRIKELKTILEGKETDPVSLKTTDKKTYEGHLYWDKNEKRIRIRPVEHISEELDIKCPLCGEKILKTDFGYKCSQNRGENDGCEFFVGQIAGLFIDVNQFKKLLTSGKTDLISGFKPKDKTKKPFSAYLKWDNDANKIQFEFGENKREVSSFSCPCCYKKLYKGNYGYFCECGFKFNNVIAEKTIDEDQIRKVLVKGESDVIYGFYTAKRRSKFKASLIVDKEKKSVTFKFCDNKDKEIVANES